jgi:hypothetical protein
MMAIIGVVAAAAFLAWLVGFGRREPIIPPEDDVTTPTDLDELTLAERELAADPEARPIHDALDQDDDDWGPGTSRSGLPGIL